MRPKKYTLGVYAAGALNAIAIGQLGTANTPLTLVGVNGGPADPFVLDVNRTVVLNLVGDESANRFLIRGAGPKGNEIYESIDGINIGTVESVLIFSEIYEIIPEFDTAAFMSAGTSSDVPSPWMPLDYVLADAQVSVSLVIPTSTGVNATVQVTYDQLGYNDADPQKGGHHGSVFDIKPPTLEIVEPSTAITLASPGPGNEAEFLVPRPVTAVRFLNTGPITVGDVTMRVVQGTRGGLTFGRAA